MTMARNRMIKPEFWSSEQVVECSPTARLLFIGLWNFCDDGGNHPDSLIRLNLEIFPSDHFELSAIEGWVLELIEAGLIVKYTAENKRFLHVTGWHHQRIDKPTYRYPPHPGGTNSATPPGALAEPSEPNEKKRNETKGNEKKRKENNVTDVTDVTDVRRKLDAVDGTEVSALANRLGGKISKAWDGFNGTPEFRAKFRAACTCVVAGLLPESWLADTVAEMITGERKRRPTGWLGKVLAAEAQKLGHDFDAYQRAIKKGGG